MFKKILLGALLFLAAYQTQAQHIWAESSEGFDPTYNPSNIIKDSEGTLYMSGVTLDIVTDEYSTKFFKSDNNGENWEEVEFMWIENTDVFHTMTFANEDLMLLGSAENGSGTDFKIYFSTDKGLNWVLSPMIGFDTDIQIYEIEPLSNGDLLLVGGENVGNPTSDYEPKFLKSINQGDSWESLEVNGLDGLGAIFSLVNFSEFMLLGGRSNEEGFFKGVLYISTDQGLNWIALENDWDSNYYPIIFDIDSTGRLYMLANNYYTSPFSYKFYTSPDMGDSWSEVETEGLTNVNAVGAFFVNNDTFILGSQGALEGESTIYTAPKTNIGINNVSIKDRSLKVYPSLFDKNIQVDFGEGDSTAKQIKLFNSVGQEVLQVDNIHQQHISIDTQIIPSGIYFLQVIYMNDIRTVKVIK